MKQTKLANQLKCIIILAAFGALFLCCVIVPMLGQEAATQSPELAYMFWPCLLFIWLSAIPFYLALGKAWLICGEIVQGKPFCPQNARRLLWIRKLALFDALLYTLSALILLGMNLLHPSILLLIALILFFCLAVATLAAMLAHLTAKAA